MTEDVRQKPVGGSAATYSDFFQIVSHPAFRIGFLDAQFNRTFDHDAILDRIVRETPATALTRIGWRQFEAGGLFEEKRRANIELAQYRYEEGRLAVYDAGLKCKAWGHPDFPPAAVDRYIWSRIRAPGDSP